MAMSWVIDSEGEPIVVMPASMLTELIAGSDEVCMECSAEIAKVAQRLVPGHPWRDAVRARLDAEWDDDEDFAS